jgi:3-methylcrotonyl-CoA carboxylase alpha subunit
VTAIAQQLASEGIAQDADADPFSKPTGFRAYNAYARSFSLVYGEQAYQARISNWRNAHYSDSKKGAENTSSFTLVIEKEIATTQDNSNINVAAELETVYEGEVSYASSDAHNHTLWLEGARISAQSWVHNETVYVFADSGRDEITLIDIMAHVGEESAAVGSLKSPMPGQVVAFKVAVGDSVKKGEPLAVIEAMKIEHTITAPTDGVVAELLFAAGDSVADGDELLRIDTEASEA